MSKLVEAVNFVWSALKGLCYVVGMTLFMIYVGGSFPIAYLAICVLSDPGNHREAWIFGPGCVVWLSVMLYFIAIQLAAIGKKGL